jgi:ketosteroid isomerase-like protein
MRKGTLASVLALSMALIMAVGCATTGGKKDQKSIDKTLADWKAAIEAKNIDAMMPAYSEDFKGERGEGKAEIKDFLNKAKEQGYLDGAKVDMAETKTKIEKGIATVSPVKLSSNAGSMAVTLSMKRDPDKVWRIVASEEAP